MIHRDLLLAFNVGQASGMLDKRREHSAKSIRGWDRGKKSGKARNKEADETWRPHARELAIKLREENPSISQKDLAKKIHERWRLKIPCPKTTQLVLAIRAWERSGQLPKRARQ
jgi:hypothetical protein